jgi:hypothetical protein
MKLNQRASRNNSITNIVSIDIEVNKLSNPVACNENIPKCGDSVRICTFDQM